MCQRFSLPDQLAAEREFLPVTTWWTFAPRFNALPGQYVPAIRLYAQRTEGVMLHWGLIPARIEGQPTRRPEPAVHSQRIEDSPVYRMPWLGSQRCIVPVAGFYAWQLTAQKYRQPFFVRLTDRAVFGVAALWDRWVSEDDDVIESCSVICVPANELVSQISGSTGAMPAILRRKQYELWLQGTPVEARTALQSYEAGRMHAYPVSPRVTSAVD